MALFALPRSPGRMFPREIRRFYKTNEGYRRRNNGGSAKRERRLGRTDVPYLSPSTQTTMGNKYVTCRFLSLPLWHAAPPVLSVYWLLIFVRQEVICLYLIVVSVAWDPQQCVSNFPLRENKRSFLCQVRLYMGAERSRNREFENQPRVWTVVITKCVEFAAC